MDARTIGWLVGFVVGWLLGSSPPTVGAQARTWDEASVVVTNRVGSVTSHASGTIVGGDGETGYVVSVGHLLDEGVGSLVVRRRDGHGYRAKLWAQDQALDLSLLGIRDTGDLPVVALATHAPRAGIMAGFGAGFRAAPGRYAGRSIAGDVLYTFAPVEGDSGGGLFTPEGHLAGVVWGRGGPGGVAVGPARLGSFLDRAGLDLTSKHTYQKETNVKAATVVALVALAQAPPMPSKDMPVPEVPRKVVPQASPQLPPARSSPQGALYQDGDQDQGTALAQSFTLPPRTYTLRRRVEVRELPPVVEFDQAPAAALYEAPMPAPVLAPRPAIGLGGGAYLGGAVELGGVACVPGLACRPRLGFFGAREHFKQKSVIKYRRGPF